MGMGMHQTFSQPNREFHTNSFQPSGGVMHQGMQQTGFYQGH
jgi:hypothetical protein